MATLPDDDSRLTLAEAQEQFAEAIDRAARGKERVVLTRGGRPLVAVVPAEDAAFLEDLEDRLDLEDARAALEEAKREGAVPWKDIKKRLGL